MEDLYKEVGVDFRNESIHIISNGKRYFTLELFKEGLFIDCFEVFSECGGELENAKTAVFAPIYEQNIKGEYCLIGYKLMSEE